MKTLLAFVVMALLAACAVHAVVSNLQIFGLLALCAIVLAVIAWAFFTLLGCLETEREAEQRKAKEKSLAEYYRRHGNEFGGQRGRRA